MLFRSQGWGRAYPSSDLYSLGVTCIHLLTGVSPFNLFDDNRGEWSWKDHLTEPINQQLGSVIDKLIQPKPIDRYLTAKDAIDALQGNTINQSSAQNITHQQSNISLPITTLPVRAASQNENQTISPQQTNISSIETPIPTVITQIGRAHV